MVAERVVHAAERIAERCGRTAERLSWKAEQVQSRKNIVDVISLLVGLAALTVELVPALKNAAGVSGGTVVSLFAGFFLVIQVAMERIFFRDSADRLRDYAFYIRKCGNQITRILAKDQIIMKELDLWLDLADTNLNDAGTKFPNLVASDPGAGI